MSAPNNYGSNLAKAQIVLPVNEAGAPPSATAPLPVEIILNGEPVSDSNPLPIVSV